MSSEQIGLAVLVSLVIGLLCPGLYKSLLVRLRVVDVSNARSSHTGEAIRGGGLGPVTAAATGLAIVAWLDPGSRQLTFLYGGLILAMAVVGWYEDVIGASVRWRLSTQLALSLIFAIAMTAHFDELMIWALPIAFVITAYVNFANFMDGINGISSLHGFVSGVAFGVYGLMYEWDWLVAAGLVMAASFVSFLPWNLRIKYFHGDVGSYALGASVSGLSAIVFLHGVNFFIAVAPLVIYGLDTTFTLVRRIVAGKSWYESHREHLYQQLVPAYLTHVQGAVFVACCSLLVSLAAAVAYETGHIVPWVFVGVGVCLVYLTSSVWMGRLRTRGDHSG
ncbi:MAG: hypothetical protein M9953_06950 [Thermomicrobiales bacterium]|nr:hypothetical protein [Thermomicrobiales bacterium]MCO5225057.1 hypothetical protein [Thermomicrobiales bacterium]MCO5228109.1 hypothetical protein [Thermomicrobiales bacterium]